VSTKAVRVAKLDVEDAHRLPARAAAIERPARRIGRAESVANDSFR
jgi:hypothetical protein